MTSKDLIEQVRELNEKRTHVDYYMPHCTCEGDGMGGLEFARYKDVTESDEKFIALAPQMANLCLSLADELKAKDVENARLREALERIQYAYRPITQTGHSEAFFIANKALQQKGGE